MKVSSIPALVGTGGFCAAALFIVTSAQYGNMPPTPATVSITLWLMAGICVILGQRVREKMKDGQIGLDSSQLNPITAANYLVIGKASSWTGAIVGGAYAGIAAFVLPRIADVSAAAADAPGASLAALGGIAMSAAGVFLERSCETPPPGNGENAAGA